MKKLISVLLALLMAFLLVPISALAAGTTLTVSAPDTLPRAGETFAVTVDISGNPGLCAAQFTLSFDKSVVRCEDLRLGRVLSGALSALNADAPGGAIVACASVDARTGDGVLAEYTFRVVKPGDAKFALMDGVFYGADGKAVATNVAKPTPATPTASGISGTPAVSAAAEDPAAQPFETKSFTDVPEDFWGYAYIQKAAALGLVSGNPDGSFAPARAMTRAEFVTVLHRFSGDTGVSPAYGFSDVRAGDWFSGAVNWAAGKGYATGSGTKFNPAGEITRQEVVTILYRYNGAMGGMESLLEAFGVDNLAGFDDRGSVSPWALDAMHWAVHNSLMNGKSATKLAPLDFASRAEIVAIFVRYIDKTVKNFN